MAGYFNITLDTTGPSGVSVKINGDAVRTTSTAVTLDITCSDSDTTGYQMKIWGDIGDTALSESDASWEAFANSKNVTLSDGQGDTLTVYVKVRDDLYNTSATASDTIILYTETPTVTVVSGPTPVRITTVAGHDDATALEKVVILAKSVSTATFTADKEISDIRVMVVSGINALNADASNVLIPSTLSKIYTGTSDDPTVLTGSDGMTVSNLAIASGTEVHVAIAGDDLKTASSGDGVKLVKIFVREKDANWSI